MTKPQLTEKFETVFPGFTIVECESDGTPLIEECQFEYTKRFTGPLKDRLKYPQYVQIKGLHEDKTNEEICELYQQLIATALHLFSHRFRGNPYTIDSATHKPILQIQPKHFSYQANSLVPIIDAICMKYQLVCERQQPKPPSETSRLFIQRVSTNRADASQDRNVASYSKPQTRS